MRICVCITLAVMLAPIPLMGLAASTASNQTMTNQADGAEMVYVPAGEFIMGANNGDADENPQLSCYVDGYWIYKFEVTVAQYRKFCEGTGKSMPDEPSWGWKDDLPMTGIGWKDANDYAKWAGGRLPTEAEWEKAARGTDGRMYPWGNDDAPDRYTGLDKTRKGPEPVGSHPDGASPYGCQDMAGNAAEWCLDWYDPDFYQVSQAYNPSGPLEGASRCRVGRGGSWSPPNSRAARCVDRSKLTYNCRYFNVGFRVVCGGHEFVYQDEPARTTTRTTATRQPRTTSTQSGVKQPVIKRKLPGTDNYVQGTVICNDSPIEGIIVDCTDSQNHTQKQRSTTDANGRFKLGPFPDMEVKAHVGITNNRKYYNSWGTPVTLKGGEVAEIPPIKITPVRNPVSPVEEPPVIKKKLPGTDNYVEGMVLFAGSPAAGIIVDCTDSRSYVQKQKTTTDANGRYKLGPFPDMEIRAHVAVDHNPNYFNAWGTTVVLKGGESGEIPPMKLSRIIDPVSPKEGSVVSATNGGVKLVWSAVEMADHYVVAVREKQGLEVVATARTAIPQAVIPVASLSRGTEYLVTVAAGSRLEPKLGMTAGCGRAPWTFTLN